MRKLLGLALALALATALAPSDAAAQRSVELYGGAGYTAVDLEAFYGGVVDDWNQAWYGGHVMVVPLEFGTMGLGVEAGYQYLAWFTYNSLGTRVTRDLEAWSLMALVRVPLGSVFFSEVGGGVFVFDNFTDPAIGVAIGGHLPITPAWSIPVKLRTNIAFDDDTNFVPIAVEVGVAYRMP